MTVRGDGKQKIIVHETTLRDGEQTPGVNFFREEKLRIAKALARLLPGCILDSGFPAISDDEYRAVELIAREVSGVQVFCVARAIRKDLEQAWKALREAEKPRLCSIVPVSDLLLRHKMRGASHAAIMARAVNAIRFVRDLSHDEVSVDFALEDTTRASLPFVCELTQALTEAGADIIFLCDSVGIALPHEFQHLVKTVRKRVPHATLAAHTHNDLGLALANSLAAIQAGATVVSSSMNGLGERSGNTPTEELLVTLLLRKDHYDCELTANPALLKPVSRLVAQYSGIHPHATKPIVGEVAVGVRETGPQVDGIFASPSTYQGIPPELLGLPPLPEGLKIIVGKKSSRGAISRRLAQLGFDPTDEETTDVFADVKRLSAHQKTITDDDLISLLTLRRSHGMREAV